MDNIKIIYFLKLKPFLSDSAYNYDENCLEVVYLQVSSSCKWLQNVCRDTLYDFQDLFLPPISHSGLDTSLRTFHNLKDARVPFVNFLWRNTDRYMGIWMLTFQTLFWHFYLFFLGKSSLFQTCSLHILLNLFDLYIL